MDRPLVHRERQRHVHFLRRWGRCRLHVHVAKSEVAEVTLQPGTSGSIRPGGKWRPHGKGDRLERPARRSGATPVTWTAATCAGRPSSIRIGNVAATSVNSMGPMVTRAARQPFAGLADRRDQRGRIRPRFGIELIRAASSCNV